MKLLIVVVATTSLRTTNRKVKYLMRITRELSKESNELLSYLYNIYIVCANDK